MDIGEEQPPIELPLPVVPEIEPAPETVPLPAEQPEPEPVL